MRRFAYWDFVIYILLFVFVASFPWAKLGINDPYALIAVEIGLRALLILFYLAVLWRSKDAFWRSRNPKILFYFLPFVFICFSNFLATAIDPQGVFYGFNPSYTGLFILQIIKTAETAFIEEIIFRYLIYKIINTRTRFMHILFSALIFAGAHLLNLLDVRSLMGLYEVLIQVVYTFGLGMLLGFIMEYSGSVIACMGLHFAFNFFNNDLYAYMNSYCTDAYFYVTAAVIALMIGVYLLVLYFKKLKKLSYFDY